VIFLFIIIYITLKHEFKASLNGHLEVVRELLKAAASVDATDVNGETALIKGCNHRRKSRLSYFFVYS
jgi:ankyrin repeat protein